MPSPRTPPRRAVVPPVRRRRIGDVDVDAGPLPPGRVSAAVDAVTHLLDRGVRRRVGVDERDQPHDHLDPLCVKSRDHRLRRRISRRVPDQGVVGRFPGTVDDDRADGDLTADIAGDQRLGRLPRVGVVLPRPRLERPAWRDRRRRPRRGWRPIGARVNRDTAIGSRRAADAARAAAAQRFPSRPATPGAPPVPGPVPGHRPPTSSRRPTRAYRTMTHPWAAKRRSTTAGRIRRSCTPPPRARSAGTLAIASRPLRGHQHIGRSHG